MPADGWFRFEMPQPIPSYLMAIAVGRLDAREIGPRTTVFAEPPVLAAAAREFADTEKMILACEQLYGPYRWGRYDLLILPPSFPYGGMENPRLSFITPTVIAGDRSLVSMIAHELAHSWSGNLVTNASWRDFWLNEGFTTFLERRILGRLYGPVRQSMEDVLGVQSLQRELQRLPPRDQVLAIDLRGRDPEEGSSDVPYEKGRLFLDWLESRVGADTLDALLRDWFESHAFQSVTTEQFRDWLLASLRTRAPGKVDRRRSTSGCTSPACLRSPCCVPRTCSPASTASGPTGSPAGSCCPSFPCGAGPCSSGSISWTGCPPTWRASAPRSSTGSSRSTARAMPRSPSAGCESRSARATPRPMRGWRST
jgi:leukotriene-A4 hydrolase